MTKRKEPVAEEEHDVVFDADESDTDENTSVLSTAENKLKRLKKELAACKKERQEYLDGWQRLRADVVNGKKDSAEQITRAALGGKESLLAALIPALDSFDAAMNTAAWHDVDSNWRVGIEYIHTQLIEALAREQVSVFGAVGDVFDHTLHDVAEETAGEGTSGIVTKILRRGYKLGDRVIRPAHVVVSK